MTAVAEIILVLTFASHVRNITFSKDQFTFFSVKLRLFSYPFVKTCVLGAQKNRLVETVLLSTQNICFG